MPAARKLRCVQLINAFGREVRTTPSSRAISQRRARGGADRPKAAASPGRSSRRSPASPGPARLKKLAQAMAGYDLVCTYNWGAMDAALAHTLFADVYAARPAGASRGRLQRGRGGWPQAEPQPLSPHRARAQRGAGRCPRARSSGSRSETWHQARSKVRLIPNGIDTRAYAIAPKRDALPRVVKRKGELWVGTLAGLRKVKDLPALVRACSDLPEQWQLVIAGEGPERAAIAGGSRSMRASSTACCCRASSPSRPGDGTVRRVRAVVALRAVPDLGGRGDGRGPADRRAARGRPGGDGRERERAPT